MSEQPAPVTPPTLQEAYTIAGELRKRNLSDPTIIRELERQGVKTITAQNVVKNLPSIHSRYDAAAPEIHPEDQQQALQDMGIGALVCIIGIVISLASYSAASRAGGTYVVTWGAVVWGGIRFFRGVSRYRGF